MNVRPSLLDRIRTPASRGSSFSANDLRKSVQDDLENLLNTRCRCLDLPKDLTQLDHSLMNYGLPDYTGLSSGVEGARERMRNELRKVIERCEPRLKRVRVHLLTNSEPLDRRLRFRIEAELLAEPIVFQSILDQTTAKIDVTKAPR